MAESTVKTDTPDTPDMYHDHQKALDWALRLEAIAWVPLILAVLSLVLFAALLYVYIQQGSSGMPVLYEILNISVNTWQPLAVMVVNLALFFLLRAASQAMLLLLDIQEGAKS